MHLLCFVLVWVSDVWFALAWFGFGWVGSVRGLCWIGLGLGLGGLVGLSLGFCLVFQCDVLSL